MILDNFSEQPGTNRDKYILDNIDQINLDWTTITSKNDRGDVAEFEVLMDAGYYLLPDNSRFRFPVSASLQQKLADILDLSFCTTKVLDLTYRQCPALAEYTALSPSAQMSSLTWSKRFNEAVEVKRNALKVWLSGGAQDVPEILFRDGGKAWCLSSRLSHLPKGTACNHGFYSKLAKQDANGIKLIQSNGCAHNNQHTDYSQVLYLMKKECKLNDNNTTIYDLMDHPNNAFLINYDGQLFYQKQL